MEGLSTVSLMAGIWPENSLNLGFYLGIGRGPYVWQCKKLKEVVEYAPLDRLVLETDCPIWRLFPTGERGIRLIIFPLRSGCDGGN